MSHGYACLPLDRLILVMKLHIIMELWIILGDRKGYVLIYTLMLCTLVKKAEHLYRAISNSNITAAALRHAIDLLLGCCRR